jgi:hypothetical protein
MRDQQSIARLQLLHPEVRLIFKKFIEDCENAFNITLRIVQGLRTFEEQQSIYDQGRTKPGKIVTNAKPGSSYHNFGLSVDIVPITNGKADWNFDFKRLTQFMPEGMVWGGNFSKLKDLDHFEYTKGNTWRTLLDRYTKKQFINKQENYVIL